MDYDSSACYQLETNLEDNRDVIINTDSRTGYFEKVCLRAPACEKAWIYERTVGYLLEGEDDRVIAGVVSRTQCQELCLLELEFSCASAEYFYDLAECRLSRQTRRSRPASFRAGTENVDYLENQCVRERLPETCRPDLYENQDFGYADIDISANNAEEVSLETVYQTGDYYYCYFLSARLSAIRPWPSTAGASLTSPAPAPAVSPLTTSPPPGREL